jgi:acetyl-CoA hydrolase
MDNAQSTNRRGPLAGFRVLEFAGVGPAPFCGMLLADLGADVVLVDRATANAETVDLGPTAIANRGKRSIALDLKTADDLETALRLAAAADVLIEGLRPGVMERLGLGPDACLARNPRLVYGRLTGWGQDGPLAQTAGHDINYLALSGALWYAGQPGEPPLPPPTLVGDVAGGALYLAIGLLAAAMSARGTGRGQVVDAAIVDGAAHMTNLLLSLRAAGLFTDERGKSILDGPHWYATYRCADGGFVTVGAVEPKFYRLLCEKLGVAADPEFADGYDSSKWPALKRRFTELFAQRTRDEWCALLEGTDACFAPVLTPGEAAAHPHMTARRVYDDEAGFLQASPAPRFSATPDLRPGSIARTGADDASVRADWLRER